MSTQVESVVNTTRTAPQYTEEQVRRWLAWLARGMVKHGQTVFLIEELQPSWLTTRIQWWWYCLVSRDIWCGAGGLVLGGVTALMPNLAGSLIYRFLLGLFTGIVYGLLLGMNDFVVDRYRHRPARPSFNDLPNQILLYSCHLTIFPMLAVGISSYALSLVNVSGPEADIWQYYYLGLVLIDWPLWLTRSMFRTAETEIQTMETLQWSGRRAMKRGGGCLAIMLLVCGGLVIPFLTLTLAVGTLSYLIVTLLIVFLLIWLSGYSSSAQRLKTRANQGMALTTRNAVLVGFAAGSMVTLVMILALIQDLRVALVQDYMVVAVSYGVAVGVVIGLGTGLLSGGFDALQHYILRTLLYLGGNAPLRYARFLDYAADELNFLQKVGGGYVFIHRYLLEHFAEMEVEEAGSGAGESSQ